MYLSEMFGLSNFESDSDCSLLAFAGIIGGGTIVQEQGYFISVWPNDGGSIFSFTISGEFQFCGKIFFYTGY